LGRSYLFSFFCFSFFFSFFSLIFLVEDTEIFAKLGNFQICTFFNYFKHVNILNFEHFQIFE
jgi:hypothetical protein